MKVHNKHLIRICLSIGLIAYGLQLQAQVNFNVKAGVNGNTIMQKFENPDDEFDQNLQLGYHVGVLADIVLGGNLSLQPGLVYTRKGVNYKVEQWFPDADEVEGYDRMRLNYIEVPVNIAFRVVKDLQIYVGPYVAVGINGKNKWDVTYKIGEFEQTDADERTMLFKFGEVDPNEIASGEEPLNALDYGLNAGFIYYLGSLFFNAAYSQGLSNLTPTVTNSVVDPKDFQKYLGVVSASVGFRF